MPVVLPCLLFADTPSDCRCLQHEFLQEGIHAGRFGGRYAESPRPELVVHLSGEGDGLPKRFLSIFIGGSIGAVSVVDVDGHCGVPFNLETFSLRTSAALPSETS